MSHERRRVLAFAAASAVLLAAAAGLRAAAPSPFAPIVHVRWADHVGDDQRRAEERRLQLADGRQREGRVWEYALTDVSPGAIRALVDSPAAADTHYIERAAAAVAADAPDSSVLLPERRVARWIHSPLYDWFVLLWISSLIVSGVWLASAERARA